MAEKTKLASGFASSISGGMTFGGTASNRNDIGRSPSGQSGFDVNAVNGLGGSKSAASETDILSCFLVSAFDRKKKSTNKAGKIVLFWPDSVLERMIFK